MRRAAHTLALVAVACVALAACGTTRIHTNDPGAKIYVNGRYVGKGEAEVRQRGTAGTASIVVKHSDGRVARSSMRRKFTATTFLYGLFTMYTGFIWAWEYPDAVYVPLEEPVTQRSTGWESTEDRWTSPPAGWTPPPEPPPAPDGPPPAEPAPPAEPSAWDTAPQ